MLTPAGLVTRMMGFTGTLSGVLSSELEPRTESQRPKPGIIDFVLMLGTASFWRRMAIHGVDIFVIGRFLTKMRSDVCISVTQLWNKNELLEGVGFADAVIALLSTSCLMAGISDTATRTSNDDKKDERLSYEFVVQN